MFNTAVLSWILGNWQTSGVYTYYSGHPFQAKWGSESSILDPYGFATAVPNTVGPVHVSAVLAEVRLAWRITTGSK